MKCASPLVEKLVEAEGVKRRMCSQAPACTYVHYNNPVPVTAALVEHGSSIVLVQNKGWPKDWFGLVSGFLEAHEDPRHGVVREVKEELGLDVDIVSLIGVYPGVSKMNQVLICYHVKSKDASQPIKICPREIAAFKQVPPHRLQPYVSQVLSVDFVLTNLDLIVCYLYMLQVARWYWTRSARLVDQPSATNQIENLK
jgi:ADP-ribose pyrophosphatase YjhB (NUDIX family)